jgi:hypothetical protein
VPSASDSTVLILKLCAGLSTPADHLCGIRIPLFAGTLIPGGP